MFLVVLGVCGRLFFFLGVFVFISHWTCDGRVLKHGGLLFV